MQFWTLDQHPQRIDGTHAAGDEIAPGVVVERRTFLRFSAKAAALAALADLTGCDAGVRSTREFPLPTTGEAQADDATTGTAVVRAEEELTVGRFVQRLHPDAQALIAADAPDEEAYLAHVGEMLSRLESVAPWRQSGKRPWAMDTTAHVPPIVLYQIHMQPGASIALHDHRHYNGVLLCTEGGVRCRNFEIVEADGRDAGEVPPKGEPFVIRETHDEVLTPGALSSLTRTRDNLHEVTAGDEGCRMMDLFTHFRPDARSYALEWDGTPFDAAQRLYHASWK